MSSLLIKIKEKIINLETKLLKYCLYIQLPRVLQLLVYSYTVLRVCEYFHETPSNYIYNDRKISNFNNLVENKNYLTRLSWQRKDDILFAPAIIPTIKPHRSISTSFVVFMSKQDEERVRTELIGLKPLRFHKINIE